MGITPTYPSEKYGYIIPMKDTEFKEKVTPVKRFTEKPDVATAEKLLEEGALWNGGVFAFRLSYLMQIVERYMPGKNFRQINTNYEQSPKISFDYEVVEKAKSVGVLPYSGEWRDLGTWNTLTEKLPSPTEGESRLHNCENTLIINELGIPVLGLGLKTIVIAVFPRRYPRIKKIRPEKLKSLL